MNRHIKFALKNGFLHIFSASLVNKVIQFCSGVLIIHFLSKEQYGQYSYAGNILGLFLLFEGLGVCSGLLQYAIENETKKLCFLKLTIKYGVLFDIFLGTAIFIFSLVFTLPIEGSVEILRWMCLIPLLTIFFNIVEVYLRANLKNFQYSALSVLNVTLFLICTVVGVIKYKVWGGILGRYISCLLSDIVAFYVMRKDFLAMRLVPLPEKTLRQGFLRYSIICMLCNSISGVLYLIDTFFVGLIIKDSAIVAAYKTSTVIPFALNFIPLSIMVFVYPYFVEINTDKEKFKEYLVCLIKYIALLNVFISVMLFAFAPLIIHLLFGEAYSDSILPFRILSIGYFFCGTFRLPAGNLLAAIKKVNVSLYASIASGILNVVLDILFILLWGSAGAALSTCLIYIVSGFITNGYMFYYLKKESITEENVRI